MDQSNYLDLYDIFRNELIGDTNLFIIIGLLILTYYSIKYKVPWQVLTLIIILWIAIIFEKTGNLLLWAFLGVFVVAIAYWYLNKKING